MYKKFSYVKVIIKITHGSYTNNNYIITQVLRLV